MANYFCHLKTFASKSFQNISADDLTRVILKINNQTTNEFFLSEINGD